MFVSCFLSNESGFSFEKVLVVGNALCHFYLLKKSMILCLGRPIMAFLLVTKIGLCRSCLCFTRISTTAFGLPTKLSGLSSSFLNLESFRTRSSTGSSRMPTIFVRVDSSGGVLM